MQIPQIYPINSRVFYNPFQQIFLIEDDPSKERKDGYELIFTTKYDLHFQDFKIYFTPPFNKQVFKEGIYILTDFFLNVFESFENENKETLTIA